MKHKIESRILYPELQHLNLNLLNLNLIDLKLQLFTDFVKYNKESILYTVKVDIKFAIENSISKTYIDIDELILLTKDEDLRLKKIYDTNSTIKIELILTVE